MPRLSDHFTEEEFQCNCGCDSVEMDGTFIIRLEKARQLAGIPFRISSGFRCAKYNTRVGGVDSSAHTVGLAADIFARDSKTRYTILKSLLGSGFTRVGVADTFLHVDFDDDKPSEVMWTY